eukprot:Skav235682  [mRNA]  locus=scaffold280:19379:22054:+ [translate_table: standard]
MYIARVEQHSRAEIEQQEEARNAAVRAADLSQLLAKLDADLLLLKPLRDTSELRAIESEQWVDKFMNEKCKLFECDQEMNTAVPDFLAFKEQFRGIPGKEYVGFVKMHDGANAMQDISQALRTIVWNHWDSSSNAPPKVRPREGSDGDEAALAPQLSVLAWRRGRPLWPDPLTFKFPEGTTEHSQMMSKREEFLNMFPAASESSSQATQSDAPLRVGGQCDFSVDNGAKPLDWKQDVVLTAVKDSDFTVTRLGSVAMRANKPALVLTSDFDLWAGNSGDTQLNLEPGELFGFSTGQYEDATLNRFFVWN